MADPLEDLERRVKSAPKHGLNAKALILQSLLQSQDEEQEDEAAAARRAVQQAAEQQRVADLEALKAGPAFLAALDVRQRPQVPFVLRPRAGQAPRVVRMKVLAKLAGEHLALTARRAGGLSPADVAASQALWQPAVQAAAAQEAELCAATTGQQVYQNRAARVSALDWEARHAPPPPPPSVQVQLSPLAAQQPQRQADADATQPAAKRARAEAEQQPAAVGAAAVPAAAQHAGKPAAGQLLEADLDWGAVEEEEDSESEEKEEMAVPLALQQGPEQAARAVEQPQPGRRQAEAPPPPKQEQAAAALGAKRTSLAASGVASKPGGGGRMTVLGTAGLAAQLPCVGDTSPSSAAAAAEDSEFREFDAAAAEEKAEGMGSAAAVAGTSSAGGASAAAAAARQPGAVDPVVGGAGAGGGAAARQAVEQEVRLFVQAEVEPLRRRGQLSPAQLQTVVDRATAKVMRRHESATNADFLVAEGRAISRLVASYVDHVKGGGGSGK